MVGTVFSIGCVVVVGATIVVVDVEVEVEVVGATVVVGIGRLDDALQDNAKRTNPIKK